MSNTKIYTTNEEEEATISLPSIAFVLILGFILYRYIISPRLSSPSPTGSGFSSSSANGTRTGGTGQHFTPAQVEQVARIFPQLNHRDIMWDLHRNRGNVARTIEKVMHSGRLDSAPQSFQPVLPPSLVGVASMPRVGAAVGVGRLNLEPDLITRYNLQSRLSGEDVVDAKGKGKEKEIETEISAGGNGWSSSKDERQAILQRRRDEMILKARRKMQERDALVGDASL